MRLTRPRQAAYDIVRAAPAHLSAVRIYDAARARDQRVAHASVYNAPHFLVGAGMIAEVVRPDGTISYDRETSPHDHVVCQRCGRIADVWRTPETSMPRGSHDAVKRQTGYTVDRHRVEFIGICPDCASRR